MNKLYYYCERKKIYFSKKERYTNIELQLEYLLVISVMIGE